MNKNNKKPSIHALSNRIFRVAVVVFIIMGLVVSVYFKQFTDSYAKSVAARSINTMSLAIEKRMQFYQQLVANIARDESVIWLLSGDYSVQEAETWALKQRKYLPNAIGLALVERKGKVIGSVGELRVGPQCRKDLKASIQKHFVHTLRVHDAVKDLAHFDVVAPVKDEADDQLGLIFASFSVKVLQDTLEHLSDNQSNIYLVENSGKVIAKNEKVMGDNLLLVQKAIPGSEWYLKLAVKEKSVDNKIIGLFLTLIIVSVIFASILIYISRRLVNKLVDEFHNINDSLKAVLESNEDYIPRQPAFSETEEILPAIYALSNAISHRHRLLARQAETDALTGLGNRRFYEGYMQELWQNKDPLPRYLVYLDIDYFKQCNDSYGHEKGDEVLKSLVDCLKLHSRKEDVFIRLGGDEFVAVLTEIKIDTLYTWHQRISECFNEMQIQAGMTDSRCTISAGAIRIDATSSSIEAVKSQTDKALYDSKHNGRDMITIAGIN